MLRAIEAYDTSVNQRESIRSFYTALFHRLVSCFKPNADRNPKRRCQLPRIMKLLSSCGDDEMDEVGREEVEVRLHQAISILKSLLHSQPLFSSCSSLCWRTHCTYVSRSIVQTQQTHNSSLSIPTRRIRLLKARLWRCCRRTTAQSCLSYMYLKSRGVLLLSIC